MRIYLTSIIRLEMDREMVERDGVGLDISADKRDNKFRSINNRDISLNPTDMSSGQSVRSRQHQPVWNRRGFSYSLGLSPDAII
jgi:hypothetical protein